ncbi:Strictosidine synthase 1 [Morus notabilis]|uniref:Strictosidine synthase 1 n=1 Tax=Morus notabilis TaxID=981085 RepID=W9SC53_9ROSA|nr:protein STRICTOSIDINE SYNTHASE-LIKE 11 [Morus notabilis]EXC25144.1 Strictosidine synthase 1 [Morus notabilis]
MLSIVIFLFSVPSLVFCQPFSNFQKYDLPSAAVGPFSIAFDSSGRGPFTGISDGRVLRYDPVQNSFFDFAFTSPNRSKAVCDGTDNNDNPTRGAICGRPLGVSFHFRTNQLYVTDAYKGLLVVPPNGRLAENVATGAEGVPFKFPFLLDVDQVTGDVYFTEFSSQFQLSQVQHAIDVRDSTGRLLKYNPNTGETTVLLRGLSGAAGIALSYDRTYLLIAEMTANRVKKLWLSGPNAFTTVDLITVRGRPSNIKKNSLADFWVAVNTWIPGPTVGSMIRVPSAIRISGTGGAILQTVDLSSYYTNTSISEFQPFGLGGYIGALRAASLGRVN